jgi:hypothetical protein
MIILSTNNPRVRILEQHVLERSIPAQTILEREILEQEVLERSILAGTILEREIREQQVLERSTRNTKPGAVSQLE